MSTTFKDFLLDPKIQATLDELGFTNPTKIQEQTFPLLLEKTGIDFHGQAQTGTGKTLAFGIPLLHRIDFANKATQALVVAPTRELAVQITDSLKPFTNALNLRIKTIYGGVSIEEQISDVRRGVHIIVGTPGRINDLLRRNIIKLDQIKTLVLDEADIMLDLGFKEEVDEILRFTNKNREIWLFSATVKPGIQDIMRQYMKDTVSVRVSKEQVGCSTTKQYFCSVPMRSRMNALCRFIESAPEFYGFIFCQTKILTSEVADKLRRCGYQVGALHGDISQVQRNAVIKKFRNREYSIVVATDVAARGIDIQDLTHVINYSLPEDHESYVHRTGRTGRAGKEGVAITFINPSEIRFIKMIQKKFTVAIDPLDVPSRDDIIRGRLNKAQDYLKSLANADKGQSFHAGVSEVVDKFDVGQLRTLLMSIVQDKFLDSILKEEDVVFTPASRVAAQGNGATTAEQEIMLSVGADDGLDRDAIVDYLKTTGSLDEEQIRKIRIIRRRTFVEVVPGVAAPLLDALRNTSLAGRQTRAQMAENNDSFGGERGGSERGGNRGEYRGGRSQGGYRGGNGRSGGRGNGGRSSGRSSHYGNA